VRQVKSIVNTSNLDLITIFYRFAAALVLGALVGLEREHVHETQDSEREEFAGLRTFAFIGLLGCGVAFITGLGVDWFFPVSFLAFTAMISVAYVITASRGGRGMTTEVTALLVFLIGGLASWGELELAAAMAVVVTLLLSLKSPLHSLVAQLEREDIYATLKFAIITILILPLLPDQGYGPYQVLNPREIWLMVIFISGINFTGYVLSKVLEARRGILLTGLVGGLASSTAVTLGFSQRSREEPRLARAFILGITAASMLMFGRMWFEALAINAELARALILPLALPLIVGIVWAAYLYFAERPTEKGEVHFNNPFQLKSAIQFGLFFAGVLLLAEWMQNTMGSAGVYLSSVASGLTDVDAITLSMARLSEAGEIATNVAARAVMLAAVSNTVVKGGMVLALGAAAMRRYTLVIFGSLIGAALLAAIFLVGIRLGL
jgi:uncharacterized membrane protein (DUF4010 family)